MDMPLLLDFLPPPPVFMLSFKSEGSEERMMVWASFRIQDSENLGVVC